MPERRLLSLSAAEGVAYCLTLIIVPYCRDSQVKSCWPVRAMPELLSRRKWSMIQEMSYKQRVLLDARLARGADLEPNHCRAIAADLGLAFQQVRLASLSHAIAADRCTSSLPRPRLTLLKKTRTKHCRRRAATGLSQARMLANAVSCGTSAE